MPLVPFDIGPVTAAELNDAIDNAGRTEYQTADQTRNNNTTFLASPDLVFPVVAGAFYAFDSFIMFDTNATADFKFDFSCPAGSGMTISLWGSGAAMAALDASIFHDAFSGFGTSAGGFAAATVMSIRPAGILAVGGTAGSATFRFAQQVANVSDTKLKLGSWVWMARVA